MSRAVMSQGCLEREQLLQQWVDKKLGSSGHERRVVRLVDLLFEVTRPWHDLTRAESRLVRCAALLHDVGRAGGADEHEIRGARMVMESDLPLGEAERRRLAFLTRYHKGRLHDPDDLEYFDPAADKIREMRILLGLLRAADSLDSRHIAPPHLVVSVQGRVISIHGYVVGDAHTPATTLGRPKKFRLLEAALRCDVDVRWISTDSLAAVLTP